MLQVCKYLRFSGVSVPQEYEAGFQRALWTFRYLLCYIDSCAFVNLDLQSPHYIGSLPAALPHSGTVHRHTG